MKKVNHIPKKKTDWKLTWVPMIVPAGWQYERHLRIWWGMVKLDRWNSSFHYLKVVIVTCYQAISEGQKHLLNFTNLEFTNSANFQSYICTCRSHIDVVSCFWLCPGCNAGSGLEVRRPEYGIFHPAGVAERHELIAVCHLTTFFHCMLFFTLLHLGESTLGACRVLAYNWMAFLLLPDATPQNGWGTRWTIWDLS